jgi:p-methyltransferase
MSGKTDLDCIIVGNNVGDFTKTVADRKLTAEWLGAYRDAQVNSVPFGGARISYMDLFNRARKRARPDAEMLSPFDPLGLASLHLATTLSRHGVSSRIVAEFQKGKQTLEALLATQPAAVIITTTFYFEPTPIKEIIAFIRQRSERTRVIVGGPYVSQLDRSEPPRAVDETLKEIGADYFIVDSQGELTLARLMTQIVKGEDGTGIPNVIAVTPSGVVREERKPEDNPINENRVDWSLFDSAAIQPLSMMRTAISCPFSCAFCSYPVRAGEHRLADVEVIEAELRELDRRGVRYIYFIDDTFNVPLPRFKNICRMIIRNKFSFRWLSYIRCSNLDEDAVKLAAESGCVGALLGLESGDAEVLQLMNKFANPEKYRRSIGWMEKAGIATWALSFVGFPGDTEASVRRTLDFLQDSGPSFFATQMWFYDSTTPIAQRASQFKLEGAGYRWKHKTMDWRGACDWVDTILREVTSAQYIPQTGFSFETIFYLLGRGYSMTFIKDFLRIARNLTVAGLGDVAVDEAAYVRELDALCAGQSMI